MTAEDKMTARFTAERLRAQSRVSNVSHSGLIQAPLCPRLIEALYIVTVVTNFLTFFIGIILESYVQFG